MTQERIEIPALNVAECLILLVYSTKCYNLNSTVSKWSSLKNFNDKYIKNS